MKNIIKFLKYFDQHEYLFMIWSLLALLICYPFVLWSSFETLRIHGFITLVLVTGLYAASTFKKFLKVSVVLWIMSVIFLWIEYAIDYKVFTLLYLLSGLFLFSFITYNLIRNLFRENRVTTELILWAIAWYLMIGLLSAFIFACIHYFAPWAISSITEPWLVSFPQLMYFSYVNMTTVWYWDIVPVNAHAQAWSIISTIAWQMYLTILIWVIVGKYIRKWKKTYHY